MPDFTIRDKIGMGGFFFLLFLIMLVSYRGSAREERLEDMIVDIFDDVEESRLMVDYIFNEDVVSRINQINQMMDALRMKNGTFDPNKPSDIVPNNREEILAAVRQNREAKKYKESRGD